MRARRTRLGVAILSAAALALSAGSAFADCSDRQPTLVINANGDDLIGEVDCGDSRDGRIQLTAVGHALWRDFDLGNPSSALQYGPVTIMKRIDQTTPLLFKALTQNELVVVQIHFHGDPTQPGESTYIIELNNARITSTSSATGTGDTEPTESIGIGWSTMRVIDPVSGIEHEYAWGGGGA